MLMVLMQTLRHLFQGNQSRGREDTSLAHSASKSFAIDPGLLDKCTSADQQRACRSPKSFRQAEHNRIEFLGDFIHRTAARNSRIEDPGAIQMDRQSGFVSAVADLVGNGLWIDRS